MVGEDALCCALGAKIVQAILPSWTLSGRPINRKGITKLVPELRRYAECARNVNPVICLADTDGKCPVDLKNQWFPSNGSDNFLLRLAVTEAESWVLADREAVAEFFEVRLGSLPPSPEQILDPKMEVLRIARRSRRPHLRSEMLGDSRNLRPGSGYNTHLNTLVAESWDANRAAQASDSLRRAIDEIALLDAK